MFAKDDKSAIRQRRTFLLSCALWFFLSGVDYSIVIPTIHHYLKSIEAETKYIGYVISSLSFGAMISSPIYATITDKRQSARACLRVGILFSISGNCLYFLRPQKYAIVAARLISGIGWGIEGALMGQIGRVYNTASKTSRFALVLMARQLGVVTGPLCILFLDKLAFSKKITDDFTLNVTKYSAVGLLLASAWSALWIVSFFLYVDPPIETETEPSQDSPEINNNGDPARERLTSRLSSNSLKHQKYLPSQKMRFRATKRLGLLSEPIIVASCCTFSTYVLQSGMETLLTPFTDWYFGWTEKQNAIMYIAVGTTALLGYLSMQFVSKCLDDRQTLLLGCTFCTVVLILILTILPIASFRATWIFPLFGIGTLLFCWFLPYVVSSAAAILSKSADPKDQSIVQSIRTTGEVLAQILAPLWVSSMLWATGFILIFQMIFMAICLVLVMFSWKVLKPEELIPFREHEDVDKGFDTQAKSKLLDFDDNMASRASIPSSVICSLNSLAARNR